MHRFVSRPTLVRGVIRGYSTAGTTADGARTNKFAVNTWRDIAIRMPFPISYVTGRNILLPSQPVAKKCSKGLSYLKNGSGLASQLAQKAQNGQAASSSPAPDAGRRSSEKMSPTINSRRRLTNAEVAELKGALNPSGAALAELSSTGLQKSANTRWNKSRGRGGRGLERQERPALAKSPLPRFAPRPKAPLLLPGRVVTASDADESILDLKEEDEVELPQAAITTPDFPSADVENAFGPMASTSITNSTRLPKRSPRWVQETIGGDYQRFASALPATSPYALPTQDALLHSEFVLSKNQNVSIATRQEAIKIIQSLVGDNAGKRRG